MSFYSSKLFSSQRKMNNSLLALSHKLLYKPSLNPQWGKMSSASEDQEAGNTCRFVHSTPLFFFFGPVRFNGSPWLSLYFTLLFIFFRVSCSHEPTCSSPQNNLKWKRLFLTTKTYSPSCCGHQ